MHTFFALALKGSKIWWKEAHTGRHTHTHTHTHTQEEGESNGRNI